MRGSAIYFAEQLAGQQQEELDSVDVIFTSDMTAVADLRALLPGALQNKPIVCYFHENQLTYPLPDESDRDYQYGFTNITSCLASDVVWFNSQYHRDIFLEAVEGLLKKMPDYVPVGIGQAIQERARIMPLGLAEELFALPRAKKNGQTVTILWNHRWEYDKNPDDFFEVLFDLDRAGVDFRLIVAGENFRAAPPIFAAAEKVLAHRIDYFGYVRGRGDYLKLLRKADVVVSTAIHEFFGLSVLEGIAAGCYPLLPNRLSYPELLPKEIHEQHLYKDVDELKTKLADLCQNSAAGLSPLLERRVAELAWPRLIDSYDKAFEGVISSA